MVVGFEVWADFGHFSHPATVYSSLTYPVPPKTTVMGMLGAIAGLDEYLGLNAMRYSVVVERLEGKRQFCFNGIKDALKELDPKKGGGFRKGRKQFYRELLIDPHYRIYCDLGDVEGELRSTVVAALQREVACYPLYMGINFCLANYRFLGEFSPKPQQKEEVWIDSIVPLTYDFVIEPGKQYTDVRMARSVSEGRLFGDFTDYLVETTGQPILCKNAEFVQVGDRKIVWS